jgi:glycosyltransferase involved in cell wall biosynthesis
MKRSSLGIEGGRLRGSGDAPARKCWQVLTMLRVLQVTPALDAGGVERTTIEVAEAISKAGGLAMVASRGGRLADELAAAGGELVELPLDSKNPIRIWRNAAALAEIVVRREISIIHARSRAPAWSALWAARRTNTAFVTTYHGIYNARSALKRAYNSVMAKGDMVIANSEYTGAHLRAEHHVDPARVVVIPRGVDLARFDPPAVELARKAALRAAWGLPTEAGDAVVILPARLTAWKGQTTLIEAARIIEARRPGLARYVLAGDPQGRAAYFAALERQIGTAGLGGRVHIVGHVADMPAAFALADVAAFPSLEPEAFGRGAIEAQAMGLPVVAAAHGGLTETVVPGVTGLHVPPGDAAALAASLEQVLLMEPAQRAAMGRAGQARVRALYSTSALQTATLAVYERVLRERG